MNDQLKKIQTFTCSEQMENFCSAEQDIDVVLNLKSVLDDAYYNDESLISDELYDVLDSFIIKHHKHLKKTVGAKIRKDNNNRANLPFWMGSVDKITPADIKPLERWIQKHSSFPKIYIVTEKLDGVSGLYTNTNHLYTRGDGSVGADISCLLPILKLPDLKDKNILAVRGEFIIPDSIFIEKYKDTNSNARNMVSGLILSKTQKKSLKDVCFIAYEIIYEGHSKPHLTQLTDLKNAGFNIPAYKVLEDLNIDVLTELNDRFKSESAFKLDGIIISSNQMYDRNTSGNPEYMFAFKSQSKDSIVSSTVIDIHWEISRWGIFVPIILIEPVTIDGKTISRISGSNASLLQHRKCGIGSKVCVTFTNDVIPFITSVIEPSDEFKFPSETWDENEVCLLADSTNPSVKKIMEIKAIVSFFCKMGIKFVCESTVTKMYNKGFTSILACVKISELELKNCGFKEKSATRILENIKNGLSGVTAPKLLSASGVFGQGISIKKLEDLFLNLPEFLSSPGSISKERISQIDGFSDITATKILNGIARAIEFIDGISQYVEFKNNSRVSDSFIGKKIVFSGFRSSELENFVINRGGKIMSAVSKKTDILVVNDLTPTVKLEKARTLNILMMTKEEFIKQL